MSGMDGEWDPWRTYHLIPFRSSDGGSIMMAWKGRLNKVLPSPLSVKGDGELEAFELDRGRNAASFFQRYKVHILELIDWYVLARSWKKGQKCRALLGPSSLPKYKKKKTEIPQKKKLPKALPPTRKEVGGYEKPHFGAFTSIRVNFL